MPIRFSSVSSSCQVAGAALGRGVAAIQQAVDKDVGQPLLFGQLDQGIEVGVVGVDPAVGQQPGQVQAATAGLDLGDAVQQRRIGEEIAVLDRFGDAGEVLVDDPAGPQVEVPHLGVAHLPFRQADRHAGGADLHMGELAAGSRTGSGSWPGPRRCLSGLGLIPQPSRIIRTNGFFISAAPCLRSAGPSGSCCCAFFFFALVQLFDDHLVAFLEGAFGNLDKTGVAHADLNRYRHRFAVSQQIDLRAGRCAAAFAPASATYRKVRALFLVGVITGPESAGPPMAA